MASHFYLVKGYIQEEGNKTKTYIKKVITDDKDNEFVTYHNFKKKISRWRNKYGPYNTTIRKSGTATFYNIGKPILGNFILRRWISSIDNKTVTIGYNF